MLHRPTGPHCLTIYFFQAAYASTVGSGINISIIMYKRQAVQIYNTAELQHQQMTALKILANHLADLSDAEPANDNCKSISVSAQCVCTIDLVVKLTTKSMVCTRMFLPIDGYFV